MGGAEGGCLWTAHYVAHYARTQGALSARPRPGNLVRHSSRRCFFFFFFFDRCCCCCCCRSRLSVPRSPVSNLSMLYSTYLEKNVREIELGVDLHWRCMMLLRGCQRRRRSNANKIKMHKHMYIYIFLTRG